MPSFERESKRIVIAGASSLLGAELKSFLEESRFAGWDLRLVDEELAAGTLTEAGGEPAVIQPVEEGSFERARLVFFTGSKRSEEHTSELQSHHDLVCRLLLEKKKNREYGHHDLQVRSEVSLLKCITLIMYLLI